MAFDKETAAKVETLYREHLEEAFRGTLTFHSITVELTENMIDQDAFHVVVAYDGDGWLLDPAKLNRISSQMVDQAIGLAIENTILESFVDHREYTGQYARAEGPLERVSRNTKWQALLDIARDPLTSQDPPTVTELNLAVDRCYFAMYHALCRINARSLAGTIRTQRPDDWLKVYMGMDEGSIADRFRQYRPKASQAVNDFGATFAIIQEHRDRAMERPGSTFFPSELARLIQRAETSIVALEAQSADEQRSLAINLLVGKLRGWGSRSRTATDAVWSSAG